MWQAYVERDLHQKPTDSVWCIDRSALVLCLPRVRQKRDVYIWTETHKRDLYTSTETYTRDLLTP